MQLPFHRFQAAGDIVFVNTYQKLPFNRLAQLLATARIARHTHVLLCVMPGLYVHAVPHSGVGFIAAESDKGNFPAIYGNNWEVRRSSALHSDIQRAAQVSARAQYYIGQSYNAAFGLSRYLPEQWRHSHSFCSELIARVYKDLNLPITARDPARVLPLHLELATRSGHPWLDVTAEYSLWLTRVNYQMSSSESLDWKVSEVTRLVYVDSVRAILNTSVVLHSAIPKLNVIKSAMPSSQEQFEALSASTKANLFGLFDMNQRSFNDLHAALLDGVFLLDDQLSAADKPAPEKDPANWVMKTAEPLASSHSPDDFYNQLKGAIERSRLLITQTAGILLRGIEPYLMLALHHRGEEPLLGDLQQQSKDVLDRAIHLLDGVEDFADYDADLAAHEHDIQEHLAAQFLKTDKAQTLLRGIVQEIHDRRILRSKVRPELDRLRQNPSERTTAYELYQNLLLLTSREAS